MFRDTGKIFAQVSLLDYLYLRKRQRRVLAFFIRIKGESAVGMSSVGSLKVLEAQPLFVPASYLIDPSPFLIG